MDSVEKTVIDYLLVMHGIEHVKVTDTFKGIGLDSLDFIETIMNLEQAYSIILSDIDINQGKRMTVQQVIDLIQERIDK
jgi:acyl carrier protein